VPHRALVFLLCTACARSPRPAPAPTPDLDIDRARARLCDNLPPPPSQRVEACRLLGDFAAAGPVACPASGTEVWFGQTVVGSATSDRPESESFLVVHVSAGPLDAAALAPFDLRPADVLPCSARDLPFSRYLRPVSSVLGLEREAREAQDAHALVAAFVAGRVPEARLVAWARALTSDPAGFKVMRGPAALVLTAGASRALRPHLSGFARQTRDGRMLICAETGCSELWRLP
jgi:hypothetical protein